MPCTSLKIEGLIRSGSFLSKTRIWPGKPFFTTGWSRQDKLGTSLRRKGSASSHPSTQMEDSKLFWSSTTFYSGGWILSTEIFQSTVFRCIPPYWTKPNPYPPYTLNDFWFQTFSFISVIHFLYIYNRSCAERSLDIKSTAQHFVQGTIIYLLEVGNITHS